MLKFTPPELKGTKKYIRDLAVSQLPTGNTYWFEELPQIPFILKKQKFILETSFVGKKHDIILNDKLHKSIVPDKNPYEVLMVLNPGIYEFKILCGNEEISGAFQVSIKEYLWQSWIYSLEQTFLDLELIEGRFKNPLHLLLQEITYLPEIQNLANSSWSLRNYSKSTSTQGLKSSFKLFASGILQHNAILPRIQYSITDPQEEYSKVSMHFIHPTLARRGFFLQMFPSETISSTSWNQAILTKQDNRKISQLVLDTSSTLTIFSNVRTSFTLWNNGKSVGQFVFNSEKSSTNLFAYEFLRIPEGTYTIIGDSLNEYTRPLPLEVVLAKKDSLSLTLNYLPARTTISVNIDSNVKWVLQSGSLRLDNIGSQEVDIEDYYNSGYKVWVLTIDPLPGFEIPDAMTLDPLPKQILKLDIQLRIGKQYENAYLYSYHSRSFPAPTLS